MTSENADMAGLLEDASLEDLQNGLFMYQHDSLFKFGVDAVLLSGFAVVLTA